MINSSYLRAKYPFCWAQPGSSLARPTTDTLSFKTSIFCFNNFITRRCSWRLSSFQKYCLHLKELKTADNFKNEDNLKNGAQQHIWPLYENVERDGGEGGSSMRMMAHCHSQKPHKRVLLSTNQGIRKGDKIHRWNRY